MQKFIKDWMHSNGITYQCSRSYLVKDHHYRCRISVKHYDINVSASSTSWKEAKRRASYQACAHLLASNALTFEELPGRFREKCRDLMLKYTKRLRNGKPCSSEKIEYTWSRLTKAPRERPRIGSHARDPRTSRENRIMDRIEDPDEEIIDLTRDEFGEMETTLPSWILDSPYLRRQYPRPVQAPTADQSTYMRRNRLATEIIAFYKECVQPVDMLTEKLRAARRLERYIRSHPWIKADIFIVGSSMNGLGSRNCDLDLCMMDSSEMPDEAGDRESALRALRRLLRFLRKHGSPVFMSQVIPARVPIIRCQFRYPWNFAVDINWNNIHGIYNTHLLHYYTQADERFPVLYMVVHHWACRTGVCDSVNGYLSSYSWALLLINFLQCGTYPPVLPCLQAMFPNRFSDRKRLENLTFFQRLPLISKSQNQQHVGELLTSFFYYYGNFDFSGFMISVRRGSLLPRMEKSAPIFIEEPFDCMNTARSLSHEIRFLVFRDYIRKAYVSLKGNQPLSSLLNMD